MALSYNTSLKTVASKYVRLLNIRLTGSTVEKEVEEHPYYPSLLSISETFNRHHISNTAYTVSPEELPEKATREKSPSKLKTLLSPKFRS